MKKRFMGILLTLCMVLTLLPSTAFAVDTSSQNVYLVGSNPVYRLTPNGEVVGEMPSGTILEVIEIKGDWAKVKYEGKEYYMWAARLTKIGGSTTNSNLTEIPFAPPDGWYTIRTPNLNVTSTIGCIIVGQDGGAEIDLRGAGYYWQRYIYVDNIGNNQVTLKTLDGKYLGVSDPIKDGTRVKAVDSPYTWNAYTTTVLESAQKEPLGAWIDFRPPQNTDMIVNVSGWKLNENGTDIILWSSKLGTVNGNAKFSWGGAIDPTKTLTMRDLVEMLYTNVMDRIYDGGLSLDPSQGVFPPASDGPYKNYYWDGSGPDPYDGLKDAKGNPRYDYWAVPNWVGSLRMWGVIPTGDYNGATEITYGQFTGYLKKLMAYDKQNAKRWGKVEKFYEPRETFTDDIIKKFGFGDIKADSKITLLQAMLICDATVQWWYASSSATSSDKYGPYKHGDLPFPYKYASILSQTSTPTTPTVPNMPTAPGGITAKPTNTKFMLNGAEVALPAYEIGGNNYVKLRDVGALLKTRFDVRWEDNKAKLIPFAAYTAVGGELAAIGTESKSAKVSTTEFEFYDKWGEWVGNVTPTAYEIGGNNFIKLRDIAKLFDFDVDWRDSKAWIEPDVSPYTED